MATPEGDMVPVQGLVTESPSPLQLATSSSSSAGSKKDKRNNRKGATEGDALAPPERPASTRAPSTDNESVRSGKSKSGFTSKFLGGKGKGGNATDAAATNNTSVENIVEGVASTGAAGGRRRIMFLTEQVSHHPPISSFFCESKDAGVQLYGVDQLSAKFTGTSAYRHLLFLFFLVFSFIFLRRAG